jgi:hypothetical protein
MSRFEKTIRALMDTIVRQCEYENYFRETNCPDKIHEQYSKIALFRVILKQADIYMTFDTDDKLNYTKIHFTDMTKHITITYDMLSLKEQLNAMYGKSALSGIYETEDGYEL